MAKYKVICKDSEGHTLKLDISDDGSTEIESTDFTTKINPLEIKNSLDSIITFVGMLERLNLNSIEVERE